MKKRLLKLFTKAFFLLAISFSYINLLISQDIDQGNSGNWYEKLHWWKKAKPKYQELVASVKRIKKFKKEFATKQSIINSTIHDLIDSLKIDNKQLMGKINNYISEMDEKIEESYNEGVEDANVIEQFSENKKNLERLKQDFRLLDDLGSKVNEAIEDILASQIERAEDYEEQAMNKLIQLENVLDDKKAKNFYEEIQNKAENIISIEDYIQGPLKGYLNQSSIRLNQLTHEIKNLVLDLENQKIYISDVVPEPEEEPIVEESKKKPVVKEEISTSIFSKISSFFFKIFSTIWNIITYPFKWLS
jgi:hypothetical protein